MKTSTSTSGPEQARGEPWSACQHALHAVPIGLRAGLPDEHPIARMLDEHQVFLGRLERLAELVAPSRPPEQRGELEELQRVAGFLVGAEPHHQREEQVLFPALQEHGIFGPPEVMASEHVRLRALKGALHDLAGRVLAGDRGPWQDLRATAEALIEALRTHIAKEDVVLYPLALRVIRDPAVWEELRERCDKIGYCCPRSG